MNLFLFYEIIIRCLVCVFACIVKGPKSNRMGSSCSTTSLDDSNDKGESVFDCDDITRTVVASEICVTSGNNRHAQTHVAVDRMTNTTTTYDESDRILSCSHRSGSDRENATTNPLRERPVATALRNQRIVAASGTSFIGSHRAVPVVAAVPCQRCCCHSDPPVAQASKSFRGKTAPPELWLHGLKQAGNATECQPTSPCSSHLIPDNPRALTIRLRGDSDGWQCANAGSRDSCSGGPLSPRRGAFSPRRRLGLMPGSQQQRFTSSFSSALLSHKMAQSDHQPRGVLAAHLLHKRQSPITRGGGPCGGASAESLCSASCDVDRLQDDPPPETLLRGGAVFYFGLPKFRDLGGDAALLGTD
jgi:hypothetical protein